MKLPCILLAAGDSTRLGRNKLLVTLDGETVIHRTARNALAACLPLIVVSGSQSELVEAAISSLQGLVVVHNPDWRLGMAASAIAGLNTLAKLCDESPDKIPGFFLHHADMPFVPAEIYRELTAEALKRKEQGRECALVPAFRGVPGHPVYFPLSAASGIRAIGKGESLKPALASCGFSLIETGQESVHEDCDTEADFIRLATRYGVKVDF